MTLRNDFIGGSDAKRILDGDWLALYEEKLGIRKPEDLTANFPVQLGVTTEKFHLWWLNKFCGFDIVEQGALFRMQAHPILGCHIDGWCRNHNSFVEVKHSNGRANRDSIVEWYQPQVAHMCNVEAVDFGMVSYIAGNAVPDFFKMAPSLAYRQALLELELAFAWHLENQEPPNVVAQAALVEARAAAADVRIDNMRVVDMTLNNNWATQAIDYQLNKDSAASFERAKKALKDMVESDVRMAHGHGITIKRSKTGSLLISDGGG